MSPWEDAPKGCDRCRMYWNKVKGQHRQGPYLDGWALYTTYLVFLFTLQRWRSNGDILEMDWVYGE